MPTETPSNSSKGDVSDPAQTSESSPQSANNSRAQDPSLSSPETAPLTKAQKVEAIAALLGGSGEPAPEGGSGADEGGAGETFQETAPSVNAVDEIHEGLGNPEPEGGSEEGSEAKAVDPPPEPPKNLTELAEVAGLDPSAIYDMEINTGDGETVTLSELKDSYQGRAEREQQIAQQKFDLVERESAMTAKTMLMGQIGDQFDKFTTPEQRDALRADAEAQARDQRKMLARAAPELNNKQAFEGFASDVIKLSGQYGFEPHEVVLTDHRHMLMARGFLKTLKILQDLKQFSPKARLPGKTKAGGRLEAVSQSSKIIARGKGGGISEQVAAVSELLKKG